MAQVVHPLTRRACGALKYPLVAVAEVVGFIGAMVLGFGFRHSCLVRVVSGRAGIDLLGDLYLYLGRQYTLSSPVECLASLVSEAHKFRLGRPCSRATVSFAY